MIVVVYDICITNDGGSKRLARVAKLCSRYGQRVQNSVFECLIDNLQFQQLQHAMAKIIDVEHDSVRYYRLGRNFQTKIYNIGVKDVGNLDAPIIF